MSSKVIGFDLDGTVVGLDSCMLHFIDSIEDPTTKHLLEERYYRGLHQRINPRDFMHEYDKGIFITARLMENPVIESITKRWVAKNYPDFELVMVGHNRPSRFVTKEEWDAWNDNVTERKIKEILEHNVYVYFDDSPSLVERLRTRGVVTIQLGGRF